MQTHQRGLQDLLYRSRSRMKRNRLFLRLSKSQNVFIAVPVWTSTCKRASEGEGITGEALCQAEKQLNHLAETVVASGYQAGRKLHRPNGWGSTCCSSYTHQGGRGFRASLQYPATNPLNEVPCVLCPASAKRHSDKKALVQQQLCTTQRERVIKDLV